MRVRETTEFQRFEMNHQPASQLTQQRQDPSVSLFTWSRLMEIWKFLSFNETVMESLRWHALEGTDPV